MKVINHVKSRQYGVKAYWERRAETPEALAERFVRTIDSLQEIDPVFALWTCGSTRPRQFETMRHHYAEEVVEGLAKSDWGKPLPIKGYSFGAVTREQPRNRSFSISVHAGSTYPVPFANDITFLTGYNSIPDPAVVTYEIFKRALLAIVDTWDPVDCAAYPLAILNLVEKGVYFRESWIQYLYPWLASLVTPPPRPVIVEHLPNGGLLMSATRETFDIENPAHMAAARQIGTAIAPLNDLPWAERAHA
jgi:hypothetical protein